MSERKVLQKYYPPDFDPRVFTRRHGRKPENSGPRIQTVRLMAPFSMKCMTCGEFIYRGRKFNSRKETNVEQRYLNIQIFQFHIKCTRCSAEIIFRTDPKNNDYAMVRGAVRNMEPWRNRVMEEETIDERLDRLELEEAEAAGEEEKNAMADLEAKNADARREMAAADMLDEIRQRNARIHRSEKEGTDYADTIVRAEDEERAGQEKEDEEAAKKAFEDARLRIEALSCGLDDSSGSEEMLQQPQSVYDSPPVALVPPPSFKRVVKKKKDHSALLGIKKKPTLV
ncbi:cell cycle control protein cwf16 [Metarhizium album ARSEF 1941]|uniref:Splicing factor YJU2 n=1 Tax=Metarhizium album (strain ARSEF 1941) TaxID=1081103 RepID=A0A0B2WLV0_METAS|nr:cell cycle control protein cwf16 [Metarhizium album ARSEF 1941]KHN94644.1 cell cycle control protein cwf16 [Metarhizium album ARSEF 1941]